MSVRERVRLPEARRPEPATPGRPLDARVRAGAERALGHDFSSVRVYAGDGAADRARRGCGGLQLRRPPRLRRRRVRARHAGRRPPARPRARSRRPAAKRECDGPSARPRRARGRRRRRARRRRRRAGAAVSQASQHPPAGPSRPDDTPRAHFERWLAKRLAGVRSSRAARAADRKVFSPPGRRPSARPFGQPAGATQLTRSGRAAAASSTTTRSSHRRRRRLRRPTSASRLLRHRRARRPHSAVPTGKVGVRTAPAS